MKFYLHKTKKYFNEALKQDEEGVFVAVAAQFSGKVTVNGKKVNIKLYPAHKPGGPQGIIPKNPNKYVIEVEEKEEKKWGI